MSLNAASGYFDATEKKRADLRTAVEAIDSHLEHLSPAGTTAKGGLPESWAKLVRLLDLGPAVEVGRCPVCDRVNMRAATRCGHCWVLLDAPTASSEVAQAPGGVTDG